MVDREVYSDECQKLYPVFAPLPIPFVEHWLRNEKGAKYRSLQWFMNTQQSVYTYMHPFVQAEPMKRRRVFLKQDAVLLFDTGWLLSALQAQSPDKHPVPLQTLSNWHKRGLLRYREWGYPDVQNAAALITMRMLNPQSRGWLPSSMRSDEPLWWCWRQDSPDAQPIPCPYPLPENIPPMALLWTPWAGASWDETWIAIGNQGAVRWGGVRKSLETYRWSLTQDELATWDTTAASLFFSSKIPSSVNGSRETNRDVLHHAAAIALFRLAKERLQQPYGVGGKQTNAMTEKR